MFKSTLPPSGQDQVLQEVANEWLEDNLKLAVSSERTPADL